MSKRAKDKLSASQRKRRYFLRRAGSLLIAIGIIALLVWADRAGVFGTRPPGDWEKYHGLSFKVVDGDTLDVAIPDGQWPNTRIRLWGVDTPETVKEDTPVQHFGPEASAFTKTVAKGQTVRLELVPHTTRGKYGRLLAYVWLPDEQLLNKRLVNEGYAYADPRFAHPRRTDFKRLERQARNAHRGLWKDVTPRDLPYYHRNIKLPD